MGQAAEILRPINWYNGQVNAATHRVTRMLSVMSFLNPYLKPIQKLNDNNDSIACDLRTTERSGARVHHEHTMTTPYLD